MTPPDALFHISQTMQHIQVEREFIIELKEDVKNNSYDHATACDHLINRLLSKTECVEIFPPELTERNCWALLKKIQIEKTKIIKNLHLLSECTFDHEWYKDVLIELLMMRHWLQLEANCQNEIDSKNRQLYARLQRKNLEDLFPEITTLLNQCQERPLGQSMIDAVVPRLATSVKTSKQLLQVFEKFLPEIEEQRKILYTNDKKDVRATENSTGPSKSQLESVLSDCTKIFSEATVSCKHIHSLNTLIDYGCISSILRGWLDQIKKRGDLSNIRCFMKDVSWLKKFQGQENETLVGLRDLPKKLNAIRECYDDCQKFINERRSHLHVFQQEEILQGENLRVQLTAKNQTLLTLLASKNNLYRPGKQYLELIDQMIKCIDFNNNFSSETVKTISRIITELNQRLVKGTLTANDFVCLIPHLYEEGTMNTILLNQLKMITGNREVALLSCKEERKHNTEEKS